jgi:predicted methyltransferase
MTKRLTRPQVQRFLILCQLNDTHTPTLFKKILKDMMEDKFVAFENSEFVITDKGRREMERLLILSGENNGERISTSISS